MSTLVSLRRQERPAPRNTAFARDVHAGLNAAVKTLPAKYFYDQRGSELFEEICRLPEYYPTRTESKILREQGAAMAGIIGPDVEVVEFGAGAAEKSACCSAPCHARPAICPSTFPARICRLRWHR